MNTSGDSLRELDRHLSTYSYAAGYCPSVLDLDLINSIGGVGVVANQLPNLARWKRHLESFTPDELKRAEYKDDKALDSLRHLLNSMPSAALDGVLDPHLQQKLSLKEQARSTPTSSMTGDSSELPTLLLSVLDSKNAFRTDELASELHVDHQKVVGAMKSLQNHQGLIDVENVDVDTITLTDEGRGIAESGSHEFNVFRAIGEQGSPQADILKLSCGKLGIAKAMQNGWIAMDKSGGVNKCVRKVAEVEDVVCEQLRAIRDGKAAQLGKNTLSELKKRKLISETRLKVYRVSKGPHFTTLLEKPEVDLTAEMIASGSWRGKTFKKYNFDSLGIPPASGHLHPLMKVRAEFRDIFLQMGFTEMPTSRYVESSFWNFDALFQPQQHPARDSHDTFFISEPALSTDFPEEYLERVKEVHSKGGYGSLGYQYEWKREEAQKNVLRTHTTAITARQLYLLAQQKEFTPVKLFSIDRVFRNETLDATHLAEFHQVEGVVADRNLSLAHVIGLFTEFYRKCGIENLRFKPTYNPYTEPSMEIYAFHNGLNRWVEIGNSGIFRPEMLLPMGLPEDVNVAGFGLSLERPTMIRYGINNIRELFGHRINLEMVYKNPICRLDKAS